MRQARRFYRCVVIMVCLLCQQACTIAKTENQYTLTGDNNTITGTDTISTQKSTDVDASAAASQNGAAGVAQ